MVAFSFWEGGIYDLDFKLRTNVYNWVPSERVQGNKCLFSLIPELLIWSRPDKVVRSIFR